MYWANKKVFVTGAGGFIGSHLCEKLVDLGADVTALVRYNSRGSYGFLEETVILKDKARIVMGDIRDETTFRTYLKNIDVVFHLAAIPGIPYSFLFPRDVFEINAGGSLNLLIAAREFGVGKIVLASSAETYGDSKYLPIDEDHPQYPKSQYAASKAAMEKVAWSFFYADGLPVNVVRLFNNYGPRQSARAVTPTIITQLLAGDEVKIGSLDPKRDFTFVLDTLEALLKVGELEEYGNVFNIGFGISISVQEILDTACKILEKKRIKVVTEGYRIRPGQSEVWSLMANNSRLKETTGWQPKFSYEEGLKITIEWMREHMADYKPGKYSI
jgi:dTDP-glucose 4,6-dehydratase